MEDALTRTVRRLKEGQAVEDGARDLVDQFRARLLSYFRRHRFSDADAEDLVQETFRRVLTGVRGLVDPDRFTPWLFQIARNVRLSAQPAAIQQRERIADVDPGDRRDPQPDPLASAIHAERIGRVWAAVARLPDRQRQCLILRVVHDMSYDEIAAVLNLSLRTVRNHLREARMTLRRDVDSSMKGAPDERV